MTQYKNRLSASIQASISMLGTQSLESPQDFLVYKVYLPRRPKILIETLEINKNEKPNGFLTAKTSKTKKKPNLIMIHGLGGSYAAQFKLYQALSEKFHIFALDLPGMGTSYRYKWNFKDTKSIMTFYNESIEEWRQVLKIDTFYIFGYSVGGYFAMNYLNSHQPEGCLGVF
jgi:pimeloyl-ACP methyl ester carboxylesterase